MIVGRVAVHQRINWISTAYIATSRQLRVLVNTYAFEQKRDEHDTKSGVMLVEKFKLELAELSDDHSMPKPG
jgi:hypothetical protein